jgi:hypothetical protein
VTSSIIAAVSPQFERTFWAVVIVVTVGGIVLRPFSPRRIGGPDGGSEKAIVGVIWVLAALALGFFMFHDAGD